MVIQIQDPGRGRHKPGRNLNAVGPSALPDDWSWSVPHAMTPSEIQMMIDDFVLELRGRLSERLRMTGERFYLVGETLRYLQQDSTKPEVVRA